MTITLTFESAAEFASFIGEKDCSKQIEELKRQLAYHKILNEDYSKAIDEHNKIVENYERRIASQKQAIEDFKVGNKVSCQEVVFTNNKQQAKAER
jgi:hypothetical protein